MSSPRLLHRQAAQHIDERYKRKQSELFLSQQERTIGSLGTELSEPTFTFECFSLKAVKNSCKMQSFCLCTHSLTLS